jgi:hypothetical protein
MKQKNKQQTTSAYLEVFVCIMKKDQKVILDNYAYMLRLDYLGKSRQQIIKILQQFIEDEEIFKYHIHEEKGEQTDKLHAQCIVWSDYDYNAKERQQLKRNYFKEALETKSNAVAITDAQKPQNLASYSSKDGLCIMSNLTDQEINRIPLWKDKKEYKDKEWKKNLKAYCKTLKNASINEFIISITQYHWDNERTQPARHSMIKLLGLYNNYYTAEDYCYSLGISKAREQYIPQCEANM